MDPIITFFTLLVLWNVLMAVGMVIACVVIVPVRIVRNMLFMRWVRKGKYLW